MNSRPCARTVCWNLSREHTAHSLFPRNSVGTSQGIYPKTMAKYQRSIEFIVEKLGGKGVVELERLGHCILCQ